MVNNIISHYMNNSSVRQGASWSWSLNSWIDNYLCSQCLSPLNLWFQPRWWRDLLDTTLCDNVCQWLATGRWFSLSGVVQQYNWPPRYNWNIVETGVKLHKSTHLFCQTWPSKDRNDNAKNRLKSWSWQL